MQEKTIKLTNLLETLNDPSEKNFVITETFPWWTINREHAVLSALIQILIDEFQDGEIK
jgi:hypothetical protein